MPSDRIRPSFRAKAAASRRTPRPPAAAKQTGTDRMRRSLFRSAQACLRFLAAITQARLKMRSEHVQPSLRAKAAAIRLRRTHSKAAFGGKADRDEPHEAKPLSECASLLALSRRDHSGSAEDAIGPRTAQFPRQSGGKADRDRPHEAKPLSECASLLALSRRDHSGSAEDAIGARTAQFPRQSGGNPPPADALQGRLRRQRTAGDCVGPAPSPVICVRPAPPPVISAPPMCGTGVAEIGACIRGGDWCMRISIGLRQRRSSMGSARDVSGVPERR